MGLEVPETARTLVHALYVADQACTTDIINMLGAICVCKGANFPVDGYDHFDLC